MFGFLNVNFTTTCRIPQCGADFSERDFFDRRDDEDIKVFT
jgi:hypothetical protein